MPNKNIIIIGLLITIFCLGVYSVSLMQKNNRNVDIIDQLNSEMVVHRNEKGQEVAEKQSIVGDYNVVKKLANSKDSTISIMAKELTKQTNDIAYLKTITGGRICSLTPEPVTTDPTIKWDTLYKDRIVYLFPNITRDISDKWIKSTVTFNKDSVTLEYKIYNEYVIKHELRRKWFMGKEETIISVRNINPNTITADLNSIVIKPKTKKGLSFGVGVAIGVGTVLGIGLLLK